MQSVVADREGYLWVLGNGNPKFSGVIPSAPKLLKFHPRSGHLLAKILYKEPEILPTSYLNDVRLDTVRNVAYLSDSGLGAILVTDLDSGKSRRSLDHHPSVKAEKIDVVINGTHWRRLGGEVPSVHADGIALSHDRSTLYFQALTSRTLYRIPTAIDLQNEYFPGGKFPLWNTEAILLNIEQAIKMARTKGIPVIHIQHIANPMMGIAPFFNQGTDGVKIHPRVLAAAPDAPVVVKEYADSFFKTKLEYILSGLGIDELLVCGMMTQNCVTHTAISKSEEKYIVAVLTDCWSTVDEMLHNIALHALSTRVKLAPANDAI